MKKLLTLFIAAGITAPALAANSSTLATQGNGIRDSVVGSVNDNSVLYVTELDGALSSYTTDGKLRWRHESETPALTFDIETADINNDGNDDLLAASANGNIYAYDSGGKQLWAFSPGHPVRFSEVAIVNNGRVQIFAGGNDGVLYELDKNGKLLGKTAIEGGVRKLSAGRFLSKDKEDLFVMTYAHDKFRWAQFGFIDVKTKTWEQTLASKAEPFTKLQSIMFTDITVSDINKDGMSDILLTGVGKPVGASAGVYLAVDANFKQIAYYEFPKKHGQRYVHAFHQHLPKNDQVLVHFGSYFYQLDPSGTLQRTFGKKFETPAYNGLTLDNITNTLYANGRVGGDNTLYSYNLNRKGWWTTEHEYSGRGAEVEQNLRELYSQVLDFELPSYQEAADKPWLMISKHKLPKAVADLKGADLQFIEQFTWSENTSRDELVKLIGDSANKRDKRKKYNMTREEIIARAKEQEAKGRPFALWAGHVTDPFYLHIETLEAILEAAPTTCHGFIYAEIHNPNDPGVQHFINEYMPRIAKAARKQGKAKVFFRFKNVFWAATAHRAPFDKIFMSGDYADIVVPASEDTTSRTQDLNLAGRSGMFMGSYINDFAMRLIDDNVASWRPLSPAGQHSVSPWLRSGVMRAMHGARYGINGGIGHFQKPEVDLLYALMKSGVLPQVDRNDILSIGAWHLIKDIDDELVHRIDDHHNMRTYTEEDDNAIFSQAQIHWAGSALPPHDFSKAALGVDYRWLNYVPELPNGMVPIAPISAAKQLEKQGIPYSVSNAHKGYVDGKWLDAKSFGANLKHSVEQGKANLPIVVEGAAWSVIRLDDHHARIILLDQGYIDPQTRSVTIKIQHGNVEWMRDILSGDNFTLKNQQTSTTVPAGSLKFIDVKFKNSI